MASTIPTNGSLGRRNSMSAKKVSAKKPSGRSLALVKSNDDKLPTDVTPAAAKALTRKIQNGIGGVFELLHQAWQGRAWLALGYQSWDEYIDREFGTAPMALPRERRKDAVKSLRDLGWSVRAIAAATGAGKSTIADDLAESPAVRKPDTSDGDTAPDLGDGGEPIPTVDAEVVNEPCGDCVGSHDGDRVTGLDGKSHPGSKPKQEPKVIHIMSAARTLRKDIENVRVRLGALLDRDDYEANRDDVDGLLSTVLADFVDEARDILKDTLQEPEPEPV